MWRKHTYRYIEMKYYSDHDIYPNRAYDSRLNTLRPKQNGRHFPDDNFKHPFSNEFQSKFHLNLFPRT